MTVRGSIKSGVMTQVDDIGIEELTRGSKLGDRKFVSVTRDILHLA